MGAAIRNGFQTEIIIIFSGIVVSKKAISGQRSAKTFKGHLSFQKEHSWSNTDC